MVTEITGRGMGEKVNIGLGDKVYVGSLVAKEEKKSFSLSSELKQVKDADVQWRRWEAAVAAMQGLLAHKMVLDRWTAEDIAEYSFKLANALVKKFKEGRDG